jgi:dinuclear metal center YbgI/SA1388 family protein
MKLLDLDRYFRSVLDIGGLQASDSSLNGLQVGDMRNEVRTVAFAVDACMGSFIRAAEAGAELLFVHHGLFWGQPVPVSGLLYERLSYLIGKGLGLYACHLPLDAHAQVGNNAVLADLLGLEEREPFGRSHGAAVGMRGRLPSPMSLEEAIARVLPDGSSPLAVLPFGPSSIRTVACVSGSASREALEALEAGVDLFVTGEASHAVYHSLEEGGMSLIAAGHYATETWGVKALSERVSRDTGLSSFFIDLPTGI